VIFPLLISALLGPPKDGQPGPKHEACLVAHMGFIEECRMVRRTKEVREFAHGIYIWPGNDHRVFQEDFQRIGYASEFTNEVRRT
jgi:hypothetical protein